MTAADLKAIRERVAAASNGPWRQEYGWNNGGMATGYFYIPEHNGGAKVEMLADDTAFIAHARQDIPALLAEVERLTALLARVRATCVEVEREWREDSMSAAARGDWSRAASAVNMANGALACVDAFGPPAKEVK